MQDYHYISISKRIYSIFMYKINMYKIDDIIKIFILLDIVGVFICFFSITQKEYFLLFNYYIHDIFLFAIIFIFLYHSFFIVWLPSFLISGIFYNNTKTNINFNQTSKIKNYNKPSSKSTIVFISKTYYQDIKDKQVSLLAQYQIVIPWVHYNVIFQSIRQNLSFRVVMHFSIFFTFSTIVFISYSFYTIEKLQAMHLFSSISLFIYALFLFFIYAFFAIEVIKNRYDYFAEKKILRKSYKNYFLIDYILDGIYLNPRQVLMLNKKEIDPSKNNEEPSFFKNFITVYMVVLFSVYVPLVYSEIYTSNVNVMSIDSKILKDLNETNY